MSLRYFIPDWDDTADPRYDFIADQHSPGRLPYRDDYYAHEIYKPAPYDGILVSRAVLDENGAKRNAILEAGSVHRYLRLPVDHAHEVLGDCGAFTYWQDETPPYDTRDVLAYYQDLGFDLGVSVDHLIFTNIENERDRRWHITVDNAREFLKFHKRGKFTFTPIGVAQGWDPRSYQRAAKALVKMGYDYIAIGGLVRSPVALIIKVLEAVQEVLKPGVRVHLFGVSRPEYVTTFASLGLTSFDSASRLRRAWMDDRSNYFIENKAYTAIRIPYAHALAKSQGLSEQRAVRQEQAALRALRAYDRGEMDLKDALRACLAYGDLTGHLTERTKKDYRQTLELRPWKQCQCNICKAIGVEVIIFRGNNRNRRRGFHNTWQLYQQLQRIRNGSEPQSNSSMQ